MTRMPRPAHHRAVALGLAAGYALDRRFGDPHQHHPVAWFGTWSAQVERHTWAPSRRRGIAHVVATTSPWCAAALLAQRGGPAQVTAVTAVVTWMSLGGRSLEREARAVAAHLEDGDLDGARDRIRSLVGRDTSEAGADDLARAVVESLAENQSDAVAATLVWGALLGASGVVLHRGLNTLDAMIGHRTERYDRFGWFAARTDDVLNWLPARVSVGATALATGSVRDAGHVLRVVRRDAARHPSPNAGPVEAAAAAALGVRLGGRNVYAGTVEDRGVLGDGRGVRVQDIERAVHLERRVGRIVLFTCVVARLTRGRRTR